MDLTRPGEWVHLIERRLFPEDVRRHFVGQIEAVTERAVRVKGHLFVYDSGTSQFLMKPELRTRIVALDNRVIINILPAAIVPEHVQYMRDSDGNLSLTDGAGFELDISEFGPAE